MRILIIDDEILLLKALKFKLKNAGYEVELAFDGKEGLEKVLSQQFELIVVDILLPFVGGFEILIEVKKQNKNIPVIILTSLKSESSYKEAMDLGADDYISKPFDPNEFTDKLARLLNKKA